MSPADPRLARSEILRVFNHAQIYLFLGAAITTIGLLLGPSITVASGLLDGKLLKHSLEF